MSSHRGEQAGAGGDTPSVPPVEPAWTSAFWWRVLPTLPESGSGNRQSNWRKNTLSSGCLSWWLTDCSVVCGVRFKCGESVQSRGTWWGFSTLFYLQSLRVMSRGWTWSLCAVGAQRPFTLPKTQGSWVPLDSRVQGPFCSWWHLPPLLWAHGERER